MESRLDTLVHELLHMACPDHLDAVAAFCPNCHREIHVGVDGLEKNGCLALLVSTKEMQ